MLPLSNNFVKLLRLLLHGIVKNVSLISLSGHLIKIRLQLGLGLLNLSKLGIQLLNGSLRLSEAGLQLHLGHFKIFSLGQSILFIFLPPHVSLLARFVNLPDDVILLA